MEEVLVNDKQKFLNEYYPLGVAPEMTEKFRCFHCGEVITVGDYKIYKEQGDEFYTSAALMLLNVMEL